MSSAVKTAFLVVVDLLNQPVVLIRFTDFTKSVSFTTHAWILLLMN